MFLRRVTGKSMIPTLLPGQLVIGWHRKLRKSDIVLARQAGREVVKRIKVVEDGKAYLVGDNVSESRDSRHYGPVEFQDIIGSIMIKLPHAIDPPKLVKPYGVWFGRAAAAVLVLMALIHLFRIDTFIPILDEVLPGESGWAAFAAIFIVLVEVFAVPFALRMKLSPLAHLKSGAFIVLAPLTWLLIDVWAFDTSMSTGQLGQFVATPSTISLMTLNAFWLGFSYYTLWVLGYNKLPVKQLLKK